MLTRRGRATMTTPRILVSAGGRTFCYNPFTNDPWIRNRRRVRDSRPFVKQNLVSARSKGGAVFCAGVYELLSSFFMLRRLADGLHDNSPRLNRYILEDGEKRSTQPIHEAEATLGGPAAGKRSSWYPADKLTRFRTVPIRGLEWDWFQAGPGQTWPVTSVRAPIFFLSGKSYLNENHKDSHVRCGQNQGGNQAWIERKAPPRRGAGRHGLVHIDVWLENVRTTGFFVHRFTGRHRRPSCRSFDENPGSFHRDNLLPSGGARPSTGRKRHKGVRAPGPLPCSKGTPRNRPCGSR